MSSRESTYACCWTQALARRVSDAAEKETAEPLKTSDPTRTGPTEKAAFSAR